MLGMIPELPLSRYVRRVRRRYPSTIGAFVTLGIWRGAVTGSAFGLAVAAVVVTAMWTHAPGRPNVESMTQASLVVLGLGLFWGISFRLVLGLVAGAIAGATRHRFDSLSPVAATTVFLLTFVPGSFISLVNAFAVHGGDEAWGQALAGCASALGIGVALAVAIGLGSMGVHGSRNLTSDSGGLGSAGAGRTLGP